MKRRMLGIVGLIALASVVALGRAEEPAKRYESPYEVKFTYPVKELIGDLEAGERGNRRDESSIRHDEWYSGRTRERWGSWGPPARHYPAVREAMERPIEWQRERVIATALRFQGYEYQHHHIPDWDPPKDWPWKEVAVGRNGKGVDCSNFSSFVYNQAFGLKPISAIKEQSERLEIPGPGEGRVYRAEKIELPESYRERIEKLRTGDPVYIRSRKGEISHVVIWVGKIGQSPDQTPLVIDSHGEGVKDSNGNSIPPGIHLRPFREDSWYNRSASHAHRLLR